MLTSSDTQYELENFEEVLEFDNECYDVMASNGVVMVIFICLITIISFHDSMVSPIYKIPVKSQETAGAYQTLLQR